ncbi:MFS transporter [Streptomyces sp. RKAG293]|uniref:MFS transporter n=1 Tax=Streptomyces sp. RKAG293 TaxID=2893403 RepID=UPI00203327C4|nr:MFS transporter [Streptomyces sp. RKAG293]MCM2423095.1 MFS transporter [Streptomyces sp. RKAG293]
MDRGRTLPIMLGIAVTGFITTLDNTVVNVALPSVQRALGLDLPDLEWVGTSYVLSFGALLLAGGRLADLLSCRPVLITGLTVFTAASVAGGLAANGPTLIAARTVQGAGAALVIPATLAVITGHLPAARRSLAVGLWTAALAVALALGPVLGGFITERWGWRWVFFLNVPFGVLGLLLAGAVPAAVRRPGPSALRRLDGPGVVLSSAALYLLAYGLLEGGAHGFTRWPVPQCLFAAALTGRLFVALEIRRAAPLLELGLFRDRLLSGGTAAQVLWGIGVNGVFFFTTLYLQQVLGFSATRAGLAFLPLALALLALTPFAERLCAAWGAHRVIAAGLVLVAWGLVQVSATGLRTSWLGLQPGLLLIGAGSALTTPLTVRSLASVPASHNGMASGVVSAAREISGVFGIALVGVVLTHTRSAELAAGSDPRTAFLHGYASGLRLAAGCVLCGALVTFLALRRRTPAVPEGHLNGDSLSLK